MIIEISITLESNNYNINIRYWSRYTGGFHDDNKEGNGILYLSNGERLEAYFLGDLVCGPGVFYKKNG